MYVKRSCQKPYVSNLWNWNIKKRQYEQGDYVEVNTGSNKRFNRYGGHIEFIRFKEYYCMPREHSLSIYARVLGKKRT